MPEWLDIGEKQDDPDKLQEILDREIPDEFVLYAAEIMQIVAKINWLKENTSDPNTNIYNGASPSTAQVGNYAPGTNILGQTYDELFQNLYAPFNAPTFSSFGIQSQSNPIEVGVTISGNKSFTFGFANSENVQNNSISIIDVTNSNTVLIQNKPKSSPQTADIGSIVKLTPDSHTWRITAKNTQGNTLQRTYTLNFGYRRYAGSMDTNPTTGAQIRTTLLSSSVINTANSFSFQSGTTNKIFVVAVENGKKLVSVQNTTTNEDMTYGFVLSEITTIPDAAGNPVTSKVYVFQMAVPYGSNCNLLVTLSND